MSISIETAASHRFSELISMGDLRKFDNWCRTLGVTRNQLATAVGEVGEDADAVRAFLRHHRR